MLLEVLAFGKVPCGCCDPRAGSCERSWGSLGAWLAIVIWGV